MIEIGTITIRFIDILDLLIVVYLIYLIYRLLRGSIAVNIFLGITILYGVWRIVDLLEMRFLSVFLGQFIGAGVLLLVIIFQPEIRQFLLYLGNTSLRDRFGFIARLLDRKKGLNTAEIKEFQAIKTAVSNLSKSKTGALIVLANHLELELFNVSGVRLDATISAPLIESIFQKGSPLHDGAIVLLNHRIFAASVVLPISSNKSLPANMGLRHRAAVGISEHAPLACIVISEESGEIAGAFDGKLSPKMDDEHFALFLEQHYQKTEKTRS